MVQQFCTFAYNREVGCGCAGNGVDAGGRRGSFHRILVNHNSGKQ